MTTKGKASGGSAPKASKTKTKSTAVLITDRKTGRKMCSRRPSG